MDPFVTPAELVAFMGGETIEPGFETIALEGACQLIRDEIQQVVNLVRDDIELHDGPGREGLLLNQLPVIEVTLITEDDVDLAADTDYVAVNGKVGTVWRKGGQTIPAQWSRGRQNIEVIYDHGYAISEDEIVEVSEGPVVEMVPWSLRLIALEVAARIARAPSLAAVASGITGETIGAYSYTASLGAMQTVIAAGLLEDEIARLDRYKPGGRS